MVAFFQYNAENAEKQVDFPRSAYYITKNRNFERMRMM